jgi:hypothetical protein
MSSSAHSQEAEREAGTANRLGWGEMDQDVTDDRNTGFDKLELELGKISGVRNARIVGRDEPSEIHIVSTEGRSPKQIVRDVQSLASAGFGLSIDHRIVSVVQLKEAEENGEPNAEVIEDEISQVGPDRPVVESVVIANERDGGWVKVTIGWPNGETSDAAVSSGATREARARAGAYATMRALQQKLEGNGIFLDVDQVVLHQLGGSDAVLVRALVTTEAVTTALLGSALVQDDCATAAVHALLHAINRKLIL